jgi:Tol biopolymer transport system component
MRSAAWTPAALTQVTFAAGVEDYPAFSPDGTMIAYNGDVGGVRQIFISNVDGSTPRRVTEGSADDIQAAWSPDGEVLWFVRSHRSDGTLEPGDVFGVHEGGDIWRHELATGRETKIVDDAFNPSFSPDGAQIAFDASWGGPRRIWIADNRGRNPRQLTFDSSEAVSQIAPRWSPDGSRIVFQNMEWTTFDIKTVDVGTGEIRWITHDGFQDLNPVWSGDGKAIYFSSAHRSGGLNVWRIDVDTEGLPVGPPHQITTGAGQDVQLAVSADGSKLAMSILRQNADIWRLPVSTDSGRPSGAPESLISTTREDSRGSWSPDGKYIAFNSDRSGDMNIWLYSLDDGTSRRITTGAGGDYQARWSPDGRSLVFFSARSGNSDIWRVDVTTGELTQLTQDPALDINPFYSPDGRYIAYQSDYDGRRELWVMQADGSQPRALTSIGVSGHFLMWSRDGKQRNPAGIRQRGRARPVCRSKGGRAYVVFTG